MVLVLWVPLSIPRVIMGKKILGAEGPRLKEK
jgi:hypothetical protein